MYNIILAAGDGKRFKDYDHPKPLLISRKKPIIVRAAQSLPRKNKYLFLCKKKHYTDYPNLKKYIKKDFTTAKILLLKKKTKGQASTLTKIKKFVKLDQPIVVTSTDFCFSYNKSLFKNYINKNLNIIFVCKPTKEMKKSYYQFGWVRSDNQNNVLKISCKKKIRGNTLKDKVILGSFAFTSIRPILSGYKKIVQKKRLINNEYYIDILMDELNKKKMIKSITVKKFINWGTPVEYEKNKNKKLW